MHILLAGVCAEERKQSPYMNTRTRKQSVYVSAVGYCDTTVADD